MQQLFWDEKSSVQLFCKDPVLRIEQHSTFPDFQVDNRFAAFIGECSAQRLFGIHLLVCFDFHRDKVTVNRKIFPVLHQHCFVIAGIRDNAYDSAFE